MKPGRSLRQWWRDLQKKTRVCRFGCSCHHTGSGLSCLLCGQHDCFAPGPSGLDLGLQGGWGKMETDPLLKPPADADPADWRSWPAYKNDPDLIAEQERIRRGFGPEVDKALGPARLERVTYPIYSTAVYTSGETTRLEFFSEGRGTRGPGWTNLYQPNMLPNPQCFLIEAVQLYGLPTDLGLGEFTLQVGNKTYGDWPAWRLSLRERQFRLTPILIPPLVHFRAVLEWETPVILGKGLSGRPIAQHAIQCCLRGPRLRPVC